LLCYKLIALFNDPQQVREKTKVALGDKFVLGEFHDVVLKNDAVLLDMLDRLLEKWVAK
jgi:uncharacterized protein (DUF885 family)